jgi:hypothetical protein
VADGILTRLPGAIATRRAGGAAGHLFDRRWRIQSDADTIDDTVRDAVIPRCRRRRCTVRTGTNDRRRRRAGHAERSYVNFRPPLARRRNCVSIAGKLADDL